jgi:F-type H+-transporting ATPase subunit b
MISTYALASEAGHHGESDIVQRTVNFLLFVGLIWYLIGEPVKNYFSGRSQGIADKLNQVQERLNESAELKKEAAAKIVEAEKFAEELNTTSKKENKIINDKIMEQCDAELESLVAQNESLKDFEQRRMVRTVVEDILAETLSQSSDGFDKETMANIILKKVA